MLCKDLRKNSKDYKGNLRTYGKAKKNKENSKITKINKGLRDEDRPPPHTTLTARKKFHLFGLKFI